MSLIEDARQLAESDPMTMDMACHFCQDVLGQHADDCAWQSMPRIIAVLEAADTFIDRGGEDDVEEWKALASALDGAEVPA